MNHPDDVMDALQIVARTADLEPLGQLLTEKLYARKRVRHSCGIRVKVSTGSTGLWFDVTRDGGLTGDRCTVDHGKDEVHVLYSRSSEGDDLAEELEALLAAGRCDELDRAWCSALLVRNRALIATTDLSPSQLRTLRTGVIDMLEHCGPTSPEIAELAATWEGTLADLLAAAALTA